MRKYLSAKSVVGALGLLTVLVAALSLLIFPEWRRDPRGLLIVVIAAALGLVAFLSNLVSLLKDLGVFPPREGEREETPPARFTIPDPPSDFVGRRRELEELLQE